ncbi:MAG: lytic transglycosylase domain-containing protein [Solirubrobacterales bacterium]|nr:lytic transglycosylase domain-containing protein [Solirubrobacterales bacterium]
MSARAVPSARGRRRRPATAVQRRRRILAVLAAAAVAGLAAAMLLPTFHEAVREISLPLRHEDIIRQQAQDKDLDPALIAAVIYAESRFIDDRTSAAGAQGLMQITPETAKDIARKSGGVQFRVEDLGTPQVNIAYGAYYLRYLLRRYGGNEALALAAYNGGEGNVDRWVAHARGHGRDLTPSDIPFPETREYVKRVTSAKADYRRTYSRELGIRG